MPRDYSDTVLSRYDPAHLAAALRRHREEAGLSQQEAADLAGVSKSTISRIEHAKTAAGIDDPKFSNVAALAFVYSTDLATLAAEVGIPVRRVRGRGRGEALELIEPKLLAALDTYARIRDADARRNMAEFFWSMVTTWANAHADEVRRNGD